MPFSHLLPRLQMIYLLFFFPRWKTLDAFRVLIMYVLYHVNRIILQITWLQPYSWLQCSCLLLQLPTSALINYRAWRPVIRKNTNTTFSTSVLKHMYSYKHKWQFYVVTNVRRHYAAMVSVYTVGSLDTEHFEGTWLWKEHLHFITRNSDCNILLRYLYLFAKWWNGLCFLLWWGACTKSD